MLLLARRCSPPHLQLSPTVQSPNLSAAGVVICPTKPCPSTTNHTPVCGPYARSRALATEALRMDFSEPQLARLICGVLRAFSMLMLVLTPRSCSILTMVVSSSAVYLLPPLSVSLNTNSMPVTAREVRWCSGELCHPLILAAKL